MANRSRPSLLRAIGTAIGNFAGWLGAYQSTDPRRKIVENLKVQRTTANQALGYNLPTLVNQCRHLERNTPTGRAASLGFCADVIGTGIDVAPDTGVTGRDDKLRKAWLAWAESAGADETPLWELQAQAANEIVAAGAFLWRLVVLPERIGKGLIPLAILPLEVEWLSALPVAEVAPGSTFVNGIELDKYKRPIAYHLLDPSVPTSPTTGERVLAKHMIHGYEQRRAGQAHGEPLLAPLVERIFQEEDLVKIELQAARISQNFAVTIKSEYHDDTTTDTTVDPESVTDVSPGTVTRLLPGESAEAFQSTRPSQQIAPFRDMMRGDMAGATGVSRKWFDKNYANSTFMNTRMEQADAKRLRKATQNWLGRFVASRPYLEVLPWLMLNAGIAAPSNPDMRAKMACHKILPDLPEYVDPLKDGQAAIQNIQGNLSTLEDECSSRGKDWQKIALQRAKEEEFLKAHGVTMGQVAADAAAQAAAEAKAIKEAEGPIAGSDTAPAAQANDSSASA